MPVRGPGGGTSFEGMSHEQMLAWLDRADAGQVQAAAGRLTAAAKAIREIAEELKVRPQWVAWKGEGANAFRTWSADLANSTLRLGDFSEDAAKWLTEASGAIAQAQASIPRETGGGGRASNSSDTATASTPEVAALAARKERVREEAAAQMRKLTQTYAWSATQLNALERPKLPPPPDAITPDPTKRVLESTDRNRDGDNTSPGSATAAAPSAVSSASHGRLNDAPHQLQAGSTPAASAHAPSDSRSPAGMAIDNVTTVPLQPSTPGDTVVNVPAADPVRRESPLPSGAFSPVLGSSRGTPSVQSPIRAVSRSTAPVRAVGGSTSPRAGAAGSRATESGQPAATGQSPLSGGRGTPVSGPSRPSMGGAPHGIVGGRPVAPSTGRPTGALPRGVVVGGEPAPGRAPTGSPSGTNNAGGRMNGQAGPPVGRRVPSRGVVVGGRPLPPNGAIGEVPQPQGRADTRGAIPSPPPTAGGVRPTRAGNSGGPSNAPRQGGGNGPTGSRSPQAGPTADAGLRGRQSRRSAPNGETSQEKRRRNPPPATD